MKAITAVCATGASVPAISNGRVSRHRDGENAEIQQYLSKLKDLVPFMPKNRKLSKLEVILNVIEYICDLQTTLESHPAVNQFDAQSVLRLQQQHQAVLSSRQPLGVRSSPNTILNNNIHNNTQNNISSNLNSSSDYSSSQALTVSSEKSITTSTPSYNTSSSSLNDHRSTC